MKNDPQNLPDEIYQKVSGNLLLARQRIAADENFTRAVVWISSFSREEGAHGLVLNKPMGNNLGECSPFFAGTPLAKIPMFNGGPVDSFHISILACIRNFMTGGHSIQCGLNEEKVRDYANNPAVKLFAFAGMAGWAPKQLESELSAGFWHIAKVDFNEWEKSAEPDLWNRILAKSKKLEAKLTLRSPEDLSFN